MRKNELRGTGFLGCGVPVWLLMKGVTAMSIHDARSTIVKVEVDGDK